MLKKEKIRINKKIYPTGTIKKAITDYTEICKIIISENKECYELDINYDDEQYIPGEFSNYLIGLKKEG